MLKLAAQEEALCLGPQEAAVEVLGPMLAGQAERGEVTALAEVVVVVQQIPLELLAQTTHMGVGMVAAEAVAAKPAAVLG